MANSAAIEGKKYAYFVWGISDKTHEIVGTGFDFDLAELCRRIGQTPQNFNKKLQRGTVSSEEMAKIAEVLDVGYEQAFVLPDGYKIEIGSNK